MFKRKIPRDNHDGGKGSGGKALFPMRPADRILESNEGYGLKRIFSFMNGAKIEPDEIFKGDYLGGARPSKDPEYKLK